VTPSIAASSKIDFAFSPLANFKAYRHHPSFTGGFDSPTYTVVHDASKALCPFEMAGGVCNDPQCSERHWHFRHLAPNGAYCFLIISAPVFWLTMMFASRWRDNTPDRR